MTAPPAARTAALGPLGFGLEPAEIARVADEVLAIARTRLTALTEPAAPPTVADFLVPLDALLLSVRNLGSHAGLLFQVHPDAAVRDAARLASEQADRFMNEFRTNVDVYGALGEIDLEREDAETKLAVEKMRREMRRAGAERPAEVRARVVELENEIDRTCNEFAANIADGVRTVEVDGPSALRGLPPDYLRAHPPGPDGKVRFTTRYPDMLPVLRYAEDAEVRRRGLDAFLNVAYPKNLEVLERLLRQRAELARLLGYADWAEYATEDKMIERPEAAEAFLDRLTDLLAPAAARDLERFLARKRRDEPSATRLEPWDAGFWGEGYLDTRIRQEEFGVDPRELRAYLPYPAVRDGLFGLCERLFDLTIRPLPTAERWHPSVEVYDVTRAGAPFGRFYLDLVPRTGKFNHAAQFEVRAGSATGDLPQAALICNFLDASTPPAEARMEYSDVITFFHEFGHLLHALFSGHGRWVYTSMAQIEWDFVEAPSQLFEEWARDPATLGRFARNPDTGRPIPRDLVERAAAAEGLGRASRQLRQVALSTISLDLYQRDAAGIDTTVAFEEGWARRYPIAFGPAYHPQAAWGHLTGYSACYYTYVWSAVIARDLLTPFRAKGSLTDPATAERYAAEVLTPGSSRPAAQLVRRFLGRDFGFEAYEQWVLGGGPTPTGPVPAAHSAGTAHGAHAGRGPDGRGFPKPPSG